MMKNHLSRNLKISLFLSFSLFHNVYAQWSLSSSVNTSVVSTTKTQDNPHMVSDGNKGAIVVWDDRRNSSITSGDIYAQRLDQGGNALWTANGVVICNNASNQKSSNAVETSDGGVIAVWEDERNGNFDIYAQKLDANGVAQWTSGGVVISNKTTAQKNPRVTSDSLGGAIIVWEDSVNYYYDIYAQRIASDGTVQWQANGVPICGAANTQINPRIEADTYGGAYITWQDKRNGTDYNIYAQRVNSSGVVQWATDGKSICNSINTQSNPKIEPDGSGGAVIAWVDKRSAVSNDIYCQRVLSDGTISWTSNGLALCTASGNQSALDLVYVSQSGVMASWKDGRSGEFQIYAQMTSLDGSPMFTSNGVQLSNGLKAINPNSIADGTGSAIIVWQDSTSAGWDVKSQKVTVGGELLWTTGGATVSNATDDQTNPCNVSDMNGGVIYAWEDLRNGNDVDLFAHHLDKDGLTSVLESNLTKSTKVTPYPCPIHSREHSLTFPGVWNNEAITIYDSKGMAVASGNLRKSGDTQLNIAGLSDGIYFFSIIGKQDNFNGSFIIDNDEN